MDNNFSSSFKKIRKYLKKKTIKSVTILIILAGLIYLIYQLFFLEGIEDAYIEKFAMLDNLGGKRFVRISDKKNLTESGNFLCIPSGFKIPLAYLNDDYCDCPDGSDETKTNACPNGYFYCQIRKNKREKISSSRVNDGICDCCDGTDEWKKIKPSIKLSIQIQHKTGIFLSPCFNRCIKNF